MTVAAPTDEAFQRLRDNEEARGKGWLEKELTRLLHVWQGSSRTSFAANRRPPWWLPSEEVFLGSTPVVLPPFQSKRKGGWTHDAMRWLIASAYQNMEGPDATFMTVNESTLLQETEDSRLLDPSVLSVLDLSTQQNHGRVTRSAAGNETPKANVPLQSDEVGLKPQHQTTTHTGASAASAEVSKRQSTTDVDNILAEMEIEVQGRCEALRRLAEQVALSLQNSYKVEMLKLPKRVRSMSIRQFYDRYAGDVDAVVMQDIKRAVEASIAMERRRSTDEGAVDKELKRRREAAENAAAEGLATGRSRRTRARVREALRDTTNTSTREAGPHTSSAKRPRPANDPIAVYGMKTPAAGKRGDVLGSHEPLSTIQSIRRGLNGMTRIELDDGQAIEVSARMEGEAKNVARTKLRALQDELQVLMAGLDD